MEEFDHVPTGSLKDLFSLLLIPEEQKKAYLEKRGLTYEPETKKAPKKLSKKEQEERAKVEAQLEEMKRAFAIRENRKAEMHQVRTHIDGKMIKARCVTGPMEVFFCP